MTITIETFKNIAAVVGCLTAVIGFAIMIVKPIRRRLIAFIESNSNRSEMEKQLNEIRMMIAANERDAKEFRKEMTESLDITLDGTIRSLRKDIKNIYYKYKDKRVLPLYERKAVLDIQELYVSRLHQNHWGEALIAEMLKWGTDPHDTDLEEFI